MKQHWGITGKTDFQELTNILLESSGGNPGNDQASKFAFCAFTHWEVWVFPAGRSSDWVWSQVLKIHEQTNQQIQRNVNSARKYKQIFTFNPCKVESTYCVRFCLKGKPFIFTIYCNKTESRLQCVWNGKHDRVSIAFSFWMQGDDLHSSLEALSL